MTFVRTTAINKIRALNKFVKGVQGGTSAGKTFGILPIEIDYAIKNPGTETSVVAESFPHLRRGAMKDFKKIMRETGRWNEAHWHTTDSTYTFSNGSYIEFFDAGNDAKLRGARRDRLYMNEVNNISFHAYMELASRTKLSVTMDWNPVRPFWFHDELLGDPDVELLVINYLDNEACPEAARNFIEKAKKKAETSGYWANWYKVYGLGEVGTLQGVVFDNWKQVNKVPDGAKLIGYGLDFGYSNDPTTLVACYEFDGDYYFDELLYKTGLLNNEIAALIRSMNLPAGVIYADSADPKSIHDLKGRLTGGVAITAADKGKDSINFGIALLQQQKFNVTSRSLNLIKELRNYMWEKDKATGASLNTPIDAFNHLIDAMRYVAMMKLKKSNGGSVSII